MKIDVLTLFPSMFDGILNESIIARAIKDEKVSINIINFRDYSTAPQGSKYNQSMAHTLTTKKHIILICGHYEGFDERIRTLADIELSIGDFVLTGGEIPAMAIIDSTVRLIDGVITKESHEADSFEDGLLDYPVYTHPASFRGMDVPEVLLSGHHENIRKWRYNEQVKRTKERRPDLLEGDL